MNPPTASSEERGSRFEGRVEEQSHQIGHPSLWLRR